MMTEPKQAISMMVTEKPGAYSVGFFGRVSIIYGLSPDPKPQPSKTTLKVASA